MRSRPQVTNILAYLVDLVTRWFFFLTKIFRTIHIDAEPHLPPEALSCWKKNIKNASVYVEYGGGGSTRAALTMGPKTVITVESDPRFYKALKRLRHIVTYIPLYANIGFTTKWGQPLFNFPKNAWMNYPLAPLMVLHKKSLMPDLVLIDGRFRVASTLAMILYCFNHKTVFLIDDFRDRPEYGVVLDFLEPIALHDRLLEARMRSTIKPHEVTLAFLKYMRDYR
ncbi:MAG: hypothetical protein K2X98_06070 [Alphaproteobacteria bacterium]|nr:hypothetical protein [Alphaproteobacteria bacterium]MBX9977790.1 hypothetical protein [Alphaproteobacteria bacterium]